MLEKKETCISGNYYPLWMKRGLKIFNRFLAITSSFWSKTFSSILQFQRLCLSNRLFIVSSRCKTKKRDKRIGGFNLSGEEEGEGIRLLNRTCIPRLRSDVYPDVFVSILPPHKLETLSRLSALHGKASL